MFRSNQKILRDASSSAQFVTLSFVVMCLFVMLNLYGVKFMYMGTLFLISNRF